MLACLFLLVLPSLAWAQSGPATPVSPNSGPVKAFAFYPSDTGFGSYFSVTAEPGQSVTLKATIANTGEVDQHLRTYPANAYTKEGGGFGVGNYGDEANPVTKWLDYPNDTYEIAPGTGKERTFPINVPDDTAPGQYITAIVAEEADTSAVQGSSNFIQRLRYAIPVFITVPGEMQSGFSVNSIHLSLESGVAIVRIALENSGDVRVRPEGTVELIDSSGQLIVSFPVAMESIYAHDATVLTLGTAGALPAGSFTVRVKLSDSETGATASTEQSGLTAETPATPEPSPVVITSATASPQPSAEAPQFAAIEATIENNGEPIDNAQLSLVASKNGSEIERFPINQSLALPGGELPITSRYLPAEGWSPGIWSFELLIERVEASGAAVVIARRAVEGEIIIK